MDARQQQLMGYLPLLRRYARALTGSHDTGDALVSRALETVLGSDEGEPDAWDGTRRWLYRLLDALFDESGARRESGRLNHPMEAALAGLDELDRRVYLLIYLEELSQKDAEEVVGLPADDVLERLARAQDAVRDHLVATILIVEDDAIIAYDLAETVRSMGHRVAGTAATTREAMGIATSKAPTLALMDLRLAHGDSGIATAKQLRTAMALPIILVTAYAEDLRREGLEHLGPVIRKPFTREEIERAITQAVFTPCHGFSTA